MPQVVPSPTSQVATSVPSTTKNPVEHVVSLLQEVVSAVTRIDKDEDNCPHSSPIKNFQKVHPLEKTKPTTNQHESSSYVSKNNEKDEKTK
ncbi:17510_t:CDS:2 [Racocetra fulgida]|uniref:17510_t:CDS:1 n=1 Tax=Racocetra fulgida TaxID=60492 RepID=A0A9N9I653_9GLOM|nr:17510_t:CDS:2 [Racocetra fulgida]